MKHIDTMEDKNLRFVLEHYDEKAFGVAGAEKEIRKRLGMSGHGGSRIRYALMCAAAVLIAVLPCFFIWLNWPEDYVASAEVRTFVLPDSSKITLAPGASARTRPHKNVRHVGMSGKIFFEIAPDASAPFTIAAGKSSMVKVLGTRFQVSQEDSAVRVDVLEGVVDFDGIKLSDGMSAVEDNAGGCLKITSPDILNPMAWATGKFEYRDAQLSDILKDLESFYHVRIDAVEEPSDTVRITGSFPAGDVDDILDVVKTVSGVALTVLPED